ncbi:nucleoside deaminase [Deinococcus maricopensis]|uniref:Guanine deaminase n=1 Tax=Deinococcus maricopensis (strain DSM 21211 / LMG 22137 / NRRL B-23946 / LB-34) TaxID=709986 RepID=E8UB56_DEIML|nr:nucleoside deaminase [Deinococcus maricopensis]ADV68295.1 Guanine deaminase [Deinococcus maricopensis DSM 21211]
MTSTHMQEAARLALENVTSGHGGPFGAVIVKDGEIIARGANNVTASNDPTAHAEVTAIRAAAAKLGRFDLSDCEIYTSCEPCPMCLGAIYWARLQRVHYGCTQADADAIGFSDQFIYQELDKPKAERALPMLPEGREESLEAFRAWTHSTEKIEY